MLCSSVTCAVPSANRTHHAGHVGFHTRAHVKNPSSPNPTTQPDLCPSAGPATSPRAFPDRVLTLAAVLAGVSPVAQHGPPVRYLVYPARSRLQLPPLPGICPAIVAVAFAMHASHSNSRVSRDSYCTQLHSHSYRETRPHAHAWRPTSPACTATSHTRSSSHTQHTVAHSPVPHTHTHHTHGALTRGVSHTRGGLHTRAVSGAHAVSTPAVPL